MKNIAIPRIVVGSSLSCKVCFKCQQSTFFSSTYATDRL